MKQVTLNLYTMKNNNLHPLFQNLLNNIEDYTKLISKGKDSKDASDEVFGKENSEELEDIMLCEELQEDEEDEKELAAMTMCDKITKKEFEPQQNSL